MIKEALRVLTSDVDRNKDVGERMLDSIIQGRRRS